MKVEIEDVSSYEKKLLFEIPPDVVSQELDSAYRALNRNVKIKGFRPGKVPRPILERYYKSQVEDEVFSKLATDSFQKAVADHQLQPVASPTVLDRTYEAGKELKYSMTVEVKPEIPVDGYTGLEIEKETVSVTDEEVEARLHALQESHAKLKSLEPPRAIREKDFAVVDFEGKLSGKPLEGWNVKDHMVEVGSKTLVGDLDQHLIGLSPKDEKDVTLKLPDEYSRKELAGQEIQVHLKVKDVKEKIVPVLDDEFAKDVGDFTALPDLRERLRQNILSQKEADSDRRAKDQMIQKLVEKTQFEIPKSMLERRIQSLIARAELNLSRQGMDLEKAKIDREKLSESLRPGAERDVRGILILEKIAQREKISASDEEVQKKLEEIATQLNQRVEAVRKYYEKEDILDDLRGQILEEKTLDFLMKSAKITEKPSAGEAPQAQETTPEETK
jgi:trigger factor